MSKDVDSYEAAEEAIFGEGSEVETLEEPEQEVVETVEPEQVEDATEPETAEEPAPTEPEPPAEPAPVNDGMVPYGALRSEKEKRKALETEREQWKAELAELQRLRQAEAQRQQQPAPDMFADPDGYAKHQAEQLQEIQLKTTFNMSKKFAEQAHGQETVGAAMQALQATGDNTLANKFLQSQDPVNDLVAWHKQQSALSEIGGDLEAYKARIIAEAMAANGGQAAPTPQTQTPAQAATPVIPPNVGGVPSTGNAPTVETYEDIEQELWG